MPVSRGVENANAIVGLVLSILPIVLRLFGVDVGDIPALGITGFGAYKLANAKPTWRA